MLSDRIWLFVATFILATEVAGQHAEATCNVSSFSWAFNSLGQSPCLIAAYLSAPCSFSGDYNVYPIISGHFYRPSVSGLCNCNSVLYSLFNACAACQGAEVGPWSRYSENCNKTSPDGVYELRIPFDTAVPAWAYQNVYASNRFNLTLARVTGGIPENSSAITITSSSVKSSSQATQTQSEPQANSKSANHVGAIIGGVLGGLCVLGILIFAGVIIARRKLRRYHKLEGSDVATVSRDAISERFDLEKQMLNSLTSVPLSDSSNVGHHMQKDYRATSEERLSQTGHSYRKLYDPDDPSTYPPPLEADQSDTNVPLRSGQ